MRICVVYDCLHPWTVGGAQRWYRALAEHLAEHGHEVTYLTLKQWEDTPPALGSIKVVDVAGPFQLYNSTRRRVLPPLLFGMAVLRHLWVNGRKYDVVHCCSFPFFSLLAAWVAERRWRFHLHADWFEVWTKQYWKEYLGPAGILGWTVQRLAIRSAKHAACFSRLHESRLRAEGFRGSCVLLRGLHSPREAEEVPSFVKTTLPTVLFAGRLLPEKRVLAIVPAMVAARRLVPALTCSILGDGPDRGPLLEAIHRHDAHSYIHAPGFVSEECLLRELSCAMCVLLPSRREGYGLLVLEAAARGTPSIVVDDPDNAATELIEPMKNGLIAESTNPETLAVAIAEVVRMGVTLRQSTLEWYLSNRVQLSIHTSAEILVEHYRA